jgi:hypothetical protein
MSGTSADHDLRGPVTWGIALGVVQAVAPVLLFWVDAATVYALSLALIAAVYVGFAVADGRRRVLVDELVVTSAFVVVAALAVVGSPWVAVAGLAAHGVKDLWQHRTRFVAGTRWWPPFCATVDWVAAALIAVAIFAGAPFLS